MAGEVSGHPLWVARPVGAVHHLAGQPVGEMVAAPDRFLVDDLHLRVAARSNAVVGGGEGGGLFICTYFPLREISSFLQVGFHVRLFPLLFSLLLLLNRLRRRFAAVVVAALGLG